MKKIVTILASICLLMSTLAFAGGDKNQNRHDGAKGKGSTHQKRVNKYFLK